MADRDAVRRLRRRHDSLPVEVPIRIEVSLEHLTLQDDAAFWL